MNKGLMSIKGILTIKNQLGIHARVAAKLVSVTGKYNAEVSFSKGEQRANAKNILELLTLSCPQGSVITVQIDGEDAAALFEELEKMAAEKFGED
jgi:phosphocarrier protein HPr